MKMNLKRNMKTGVLVALTALSISTFAVVSAANSNSQVPEPPQLPKHIEGEQMLPPQGHPMDLRQSGKFNPAPPAGPRGPKGDFFEKRLAHMVSEGTITQEQADSVKMASQKLHKEKERPTPEQERKNLVGKTGISEDILEEIFERPEPKNFQPGEMKEAPKDAGVNPMKERLAKFVSEGKITQHQADKLENELKAQHEARKAEMEEFKTKVAKEAGVGNEVIEKVFKR